ASSRSASDFGSEIRSSAASRIQCPPYVTKAWPSLARRSSAGPAQPAAAAAASTARRVAANPNGTTSTGSGKRPSAETHLDSSAITIMALEAEATPDPHAGADEFERARRGRTFLGFDLHGREYLSPFRHSG